MEKALDAYALLIWIATRGDLSQVDFDRLDRRLPWEPDYKKIRLVLVEDTYFHELVEFFLRRHDPDATSAALSSLMARHNISTLHDAFHLIAQWLEDEGRDNELGGRFLDMDPRQRAVGEELFKALPPGHPVVGAYARRSLPVEGLWINRRRQIDFLERQVYSYRKRRLKLWLTPFLYISWIPRVILAMTKSEDIRWKERGLKVMNAYQRLIDRNFATSIREIAQGRDPTPEEIRMLERTLLVDPVQRAFMQVHGKDVSQVVQERIRILQASWPAFSGWWRNHFSLRADESSQIPVDSLWRVYIPLAQWTAQQAMAKEPTEDNPNGTFKLDIYGA